MPTLNGVLEVDGALVDLLCGWSTNDALAQRLALRPVPPPVGVRGLIDTGAEISCLDTALIQTLGLPVEGITLTQVPAVGGLTYGMQYKASLTIVHPSGIGSDNLVVDNLVIVELPLTQLGYQALLGRDVLALCDFHYGGRSGTFTLTY